jgi:hypothetical protein
MPELDMPELVTPTLPQLLEDIQLVWDMELVPFTIIKNFIFINPLKKFLPQSIYFLSPSLSLSPLTKYILLLLFLQNPVIYTLIRQVLDAVSTFFMSFYYTFDCTKNAQDLSSFSLQKKL